jgi:hypothetical protein
LIVIFLNSTVYGGMTNQAPLDAATPFGNNSNSIVDMIERTAGITAPPAANPPGRRRQAGP